MENMSLIVTLNSSCHVWILFSADAYAYKRGSIVIRALIESTPVDSGEVWLTPEISGNFSEPGAEHGDSAYKYTF
jgi:hypothetical protein